MTRLDPRCNDPDQIERMWYARPIEPPPNGWLLYSQRLVLAMLQGCREQPDAARTTSTWRLTAGCVRAGMAVAQAVCMALCYIPIVSSLLYIVARGMPRNPAGFFLRGCYWKTRLRGLGVDTFIDQGVEITRPGTVTIGSCCHIDRDTLLSVGRDDGYITIGDYSFIGPSCHIAGRGGVEIGRFVGLAARVHVYSVSNAPFQPARLGELITMSHTAPADAQCTVESRVEIGDYAVLGLGALVLPGVRLGRGAIVHPYAEVRGEFPKFAVVAGHGRARQIGWRRPGAIDPRLEVPAETDQT